MRTVSAVFQTMRPPFLLLVVSCLLQSIGLLTYLNIDWSWLIFSLVCVCGLSAHIAVNMLNEYHDCASQLDFHTSRTPFSGGSGALVSNPDVLNAVRITGWFFYCSHGGDWFAHNAFINRATISTRHHGVTWPCDCDCLYPYT